MEILNTEVTPHPHFLDMLFAHKSKVSNVFRDVLGLYEINHLAVSSINAQKQLLTFSSTPAMEFNLFSGNLWQFDQTYQAAWYQRCAQAFWQRLYHPTRYDELYYLKQLKHQYPIGLSLAAQLSDRYVIYSIASRKESEHIKESFAHEHEHLYKIGQYCSNALLPLFTEIQTDTSKSNPTPFIETQATI